MNSTISKIPQIDYIIFLDSDDYWDKECIIKIINVIKENKIRLDIVWFDYTMFGDKDCISDWTRQKGLQLEKSQVITSSYFLHRSVEMQCNVFTFAWSGAINFEFLKKIKLHFLDGAYGEDALFGIMLFTQSESIYVLQEKLYFYRVRAQSLSKFENNEKDVSQIYPYLQKLYKTFDNNAEITKGYYVASSFLLMLESLLKFIKNYKADNLQIKKGKIIRKNFLSFYANKSIELINYPKDPLHLIPKLPIIRPYIKDKQNLDTLSKIVIYSPKLYKLITLAIKLKNSIRKRIR